MFPIRVFSALCLFASVAISALAFADDRATTGTLTSISSSNPQTEAIALLTRLEKQNEATRTLTGAFDQFRTDGTFGDKVKSTGKFWYRAPSSYYAEYETEHPSKVWSDEKRLVEYIPSMKQVDVIPMDKGEDAMLTQVLLGFGVKVERILRLFDVAMVAPTSEDVLSVEFLSKDLDKTLDINRIVVSFDEKTLQPRVIEMEDSMNTRVIQLKDVKVNPSIKDSVFEIPKFSPDKVDINGFEYL